MRDGSGLENRIATAVAEAMGRKPVFVWIASPQSIWSEMAWRRSCATWSSVSTADDPRVLTTKPYYRSGYVFLTRADGDLDIKSWSDHA